jgi:ATP-binding cassette, subfamily B, bacterial PglK
MIKVLFFYLRQCYSFTGNLFLLYCILSTASSIIQTIGIVSIFPIISILIDPDKILSNQYFVKYYFLDYANSYDLTYQLGLIFLVVNISGVVIFFLTYILGEYINNICAKKNKNQFIKKIFQNNLLVTNQRSNIFNYLTHENAKYKEANGAFIQLFSTSVNFICISFSVLLIEAAIIYPLAVVLIFHLFAYLLTKNALKKLSHKESNLAKKSNQILLYFNLALKDIFSLNIGKTLSKNLESIDSLIINNGILRKIFIILPRYLLEIILFIICFFLIIFYFDNQSLSSSIPKLSVITILIWRSLPVFFNLFRLLSSFNSNISAYINFNKLSIMYDKNYLSSKNKNIFNNKKINSFKNSIIFKNVKFNYDDKKNFNFNFKIKKKDRILISGKSGSGKTTLLHLLSGFIKKISGNILIDNNEMSYEKFNTKIIGYVTQDIFLFPGTLYENISLSKFSKKVNYKKIKKIFEICGLDSIVKNVAELTSKRIELNSPELSGGQKQRIGIARILFSEPEILILDEATSALDLKSEMNILNNLINNYKNITLIAVSHRPVPNIFNKKIILK